MQTGINYRLDYEKNNTSMFLKNLTDFKKAGITRVNLVCYWGYLEQNYSDYNKAEFDKIVSFLKCNLQVGLNVQLDCHTLFPKSSSNLATPTNLSGDTTKILTDQGREQYVRFVNKLMVTCLPFECKEIAILNEPTRFSLTYTQKMGLRALIYACRDSVKLLDNKIQVGVRWDLAGLKQVGLSFAIRSQDTVMINEYMDHRNPNFEAWGATWETLANYIKSAHSYNRKLRVTEYNGFRTTPVFTSEYVTGHLKKLKSMGVESADFWGWRSTAKTFDFNLCVGDGYTPKVPFLAFKPPM